MVRQINPKLSRQLQENGKDLEKDQVTFSNLVRFRVVVKQRFEYIQVDLFENQ